MMGIKGSWALAVMVAMAISCSGVANAEASEIFSEQGLAVRITAKQQGTDVLKVQGGELKCTTATYKATIGTSPTAAVSLAPTYSGCTFAGLATSIATNGCEYQLQIPIEATDIVCPAGKEITATAPSFGSIKCILHIPPQSNLKGVTYSNTGAGTTREVIAEMNLSGITYSQTKGTAETGNCETKDSQTTGTFTGKWLLTGEEDKESGAHVGIYVE